MRSQLVDELKLEYNPVAIFFTNDKPEDARQIREGQWACVMALYLAVMKNGKTAVFDHKTYGCIGAGMGLCLDDSYTPNRKMMEGVLKDNEGYFKTTELVQEFLDNFPRIRLPERFVVFRPLDQIDPETERPVLVSFPCDPDQLSALTALLNYRRPGNDHLSAPFAAGCQSVCAFPFNESTREYPKAVLGNLDLSSRKILPRDILTFTVPFRTFLEMEEDVPGSLMRKETWLTIMKKREKAGR